MRSFITAVTLIINVFSLIAMVVGDMFGGGGAAALGSAAAERNLNRITTVLALVWLLTVVALGMLLA
jgi:preprotein translocase subunit SecG